MKTLEIIEREKNYIVIRNSTITDDKVIEMGGKAYTTGSFSSDPENNKLHEVRCEVIADYGVNTEEDLVVILDAEWASKIDTEIAEKCVNTQ